MLQISEIQSAQIYVPSKPLPCSCPMVSSATMKAKFPVTVLWFLIFLSLLSGHQRRLFHRGLFSSLLEPLLLPSSLLLSDSTNHFGIGLFQCPPTSSPTSNHALNATRVKGKSDYAAPRLKICPPPVVQADHSCHHCAAVPWHMERSLGQGLSHLWNPH